MQYNISNVVGLQIKNRYLILYSFIFIINYSKILLYIIINSRILEQDNKEMKLRNHIFFFFKFLEDNNYRKKFNMKNKI